MPNAKLKLYQILKKKMFKVKLLSIVLSMIVVCSACSKTPPPLDESIKSPKHIELFIGQCCIAKVIVEQTATLLSGSIVTFSSDSEDFTDWVSSHPEIVERRADTLFAISASECEISLVYRDTFGSHTATCEVKVKGIDIPTDTIYAHEGDSVVIFNCNAPNGYNINYEFESGNPNHYVAGHIFSSSTNWISEGECVSLSPVSKYSLAKTVHSDITGVHVFCEPLNIDLRIPIVVSESNENLSKGPF